MWLLASFNFFLFLASKILSAISTASSPPDAAKDIMVREGYDPVYGARPLKRYIGNTLETIIARKLIAGQIRNGDTIVVDGDGDNIDIVVK